MADRNNVYSVIGKDRDDCERKIRNLHGNNFQVLSKSVVLSPGFLGFFQKDRIEITYQLIENPVSKSKRRYNEPLPNPSPYSIPSQVQKVSPEKDFKEAQSEFLRKFVPNGTENLFGWAQVTRQIDKLKNEMQEQVQTIVNAAESKKEHPSITKIRELLEENEFTKSYIEKICSRMNSELSLAKIEDFDFVQESVIDWIGEGIFLAPEEKNSPPNIIVIIGPTGIGKTTTIAKMSSSILVDYKKNKEKYSYPPQVRLITTDTMRVGAVEQLKNVAEILQAKLDKAENAEDLRTLLDGYSNSDYIFIDTAGYSPNDYDHIGRMRSIFDMKKFNVNVYLAFSAGVSAKDLENILKNYNVFSFKSVIVTKCEETLSYGRVLSVLHEKAIPISWITTGQDYLGTMQRADRCWFLKALSGFKVSSDHIEKKFGTADKGKKNLF